MRGYYQTSEKWALDAIKNRRLKLSRLEEMNDPFELLAVSLRSKRDRADFLRIKRELHDEMGILCFSKTWHNPVMWSHYGDRHKGLCLGFDLLDEWVLPVSYKGLRFKSDAQKALPDDQEKLGTKLLSTKYKHWEYEKEIRITIRLEHAVREGGLYFLPFCNALIFREVIIGASNTSMPASVASKISMEDSDVEVTKSRMAFQSFRIVRNRSIDVVKSGCA